MQQENVEDARVFGGRIPNTDAASIYLSFCCYSCFWWCCCCCWCYKKQQQHTATATTATATATSAATALLPITEMIDDDDDDGSGDEDDDNNIAVSTGWTGYDDRNANVDPESRVQANEYARGRSSIAKSKPMFSHPSTLQSFGRETLMA